jgi:aminomethyltransferase
MGPSTGTPIGTCYLPTAHTKEGEAFTVEIRGKAVEARVVKTPFYKNASHL